MATIIMLQGAEPIVLAADESYNKVRRRVAEAKKIHIAYENGLSEEYLDPNFLSFYIEDGGEGERGRISFSIDKVIAVCSTTAKDGSPKEDED